MFWVHFQGLMSKFRSSPLFVFFQSLVLRVLEWKGFRGNSCIMFPLKIHEDNKSRIPTGGKSFGTQILKSYANAKTRPPEPLICKETACVHFIEEKV